MEYQNNIEFARKLDEEDPLKDFRKLFHIPRHNDAEAIYFCGNSLGLQPVNVKRMLETQLDRWRDNAIESFFQDDEPWLTYHKELRPVLAKIVGASSDEISVMNSLTVNLHLLMVSFYRPHSKRFKIIMEGGAFPSDQYAVESQVKFHGYDPSKAIIEVRPRQGEHTLRTGDIIKCIEINADDTALVLFGGVNYFTGQCFDMRAISAAAHKAGAMVGFDLAHAAGNVKLELHNWEVDFAAWCSYKYLNSGPGAVSGIFVHDKHFEDSTLKRFSGWWGYKEDERFLMMPGFKPDKGASGWQVSTSPVMLLAMHKAALQIFENIGSMELLFNKSLLLTDYLLFILTQLNKEFGRDLFEIITPADYAERGSQLSIICKRYAKEIFSLLSDRGVIGDWREPNVIRLSPVPLYNTFTEVYRVGAIMDDIVKQMSL